MGTCHILVALSPLDLTYHSGTLGSLVLCLCVYPVHISDPVSSFLELHAAPRLTTCHSVSMINLSLLPRHPRAYRKRLEEREESLATTSRSYCLPVAAGIYTWNTTSVPTILLQLLLTFQLRQALPVTTLLHPCHFSHVLHRTAHLLLEISAFL